MGEDRAAGWELGAVLEQRPAERRHPVPGVDEDRHPALARHCVDGANTRLGDLEALGARVQLDAARARIQAALGLAQRVVARIDPTERDELASRSCRLGQYRSFAAEYPFGSASGKTTPRPRTRLSPAVSSSMLREEPSGSWPP